MGFYDRDYYRGESESLWTSVGRWSATVWLITLTCGLYLVQVLSRDLAPPGITKWGEYDYWRIADGQVWRLITAIFLHNTQDLLHLAFNMLMLYWFGRTLEERYGSREFVLFYLVAGLFANTGYFLLQLSGMEKTTAVGASGAVTAVLVLYALHYPRQQVLLFFIIPMPIWAVVVLFVTLDALGAIGLRQGPIAFVVHLLGALFGLIYFRAGLRLASLWPGNSWKLRDSPSTRPHLRVWPRDTESDQERQERDIAHQNTNAPSSTDEALESKLDRVLEKVSRTGQESLTKEEREILFRASEIYKKRRR